ncbi:MAG TPA: ABC transporter ATP-binding protein [Chloroflexota bacterium]|nr:ABC transporter ATP-binding protein [Chloroflexota bacterium]
MVSAVTVSAVVKEFGKGNGRAVDNISFQVDQGELLVLLGPSGCGKTTTLRMIAGLEEPDQGEIWLGDRQVSSAARNLFMPTEKRNVGMVFQSYAIWPHMTVFDNVAYPLRVRRVKRDEVLDRVRRTLELVGLQGLERRSATELSGGQQQRVALARAMVFEPRLLLLDEPLSNLDARLRVHMRTELKHLQQQTGITTVFVTHDQAESMALADRIIVMNKGTIAQVGNPVEIYERPSSRFVSEFVGSINVLQAQVTDVTLLEDAAVLVTLRRGSHQIRCLIHAAAYPSLGEQILVSIRPEKLRLHAVPITDHRLNVWAGRIATAAYYGDHREYEVEVSDHLLRVTTPTEVVAERGDQVTVACDPGEVLIMAAAAGQP